MFPCILIVQVRMKRTQSFTQTAALQSVQRLKHTITFIAAALKRTARQLRYHTCGHTTSAQQDSSGTTPAVIRPVHSHVWLVLPEHVKRCWSQEEAIQRLMRWKLITNCESVSNLEAVVAYWKDIFRHSLEEWTKNLCQHKPATAFWKEKPNASSHSNSGRPLVLIKVW
jgi:hypothetical protein